MEIKEKIEKSWQKALEPFLVSPIATTLFTFIEQEYSTKKVFPQEEMIFKSLLLTPLSSVRVVIVGQDPYHGEGQATGLSFSVPLGVRVPASLKNIYKEIESDLGVNKDMTNGNLDVWAKQGVLLLNSVLTVRNGEPASHKGKGWEEFTNSVIKAVSDTHEHVVFILWGNYAQQKKIYIDEKKHLVLSAPHPSPLSSYTGFFGCKHFSKTSSYLEKHGKKSITW